MVEYSDIQVSLVDHMGSDLSVVNAARVSMNKQSDWEWTGDGEYTEAAHLAPKDAKLIGYLAKNGHWTPFGHAALSVHVKAPLFVARQLGKHQVGLVWNEISRRYVDTPPEFWAPLEWRRRAENVKQGSSNETFKGNAATDLWDDLDRLNRMQLGVYKSMLSRGLCPEQARMVLPQNTHTEWYWTGSLAAFLRVVDLRLDPHSQAECALVVGPILDLLRDYFPVSVAAHQKTPAEV